MQYNISIHPPRAGRDAIRAGMNNNRLAFQSTRPVRGGTAQIQGIATQYHKFQSTRPVRGGTIILETFRLAETFQSTRPVRGGTLRDIRRTSYDRNFNPPAPCGAGLDCTRA